MELPGEHAALHRFELAGVPERCGEEGLVPHPAEVRPEAGAGLQGDDRGGGEFKPVVDRRYRLDQIIEAYRYVEAGRKIGNVVITVDPAS